MDAERVTIDRHGAAVVARIEGGLLLDATPHVRAELAPVVEQHPDALIADLREVTDIDSSGLALLLWMHRSQAVRGCDFTVVAENVMLDRAFEVTRLVDVLDVRRDMPPLPA